MGNILSEDGVDNTDINEIRQITKTTPFPYEDPIWESVFTMKGYLQNLSKSYLHSITTEWSHDMRINTPTTHNFEVFILHMSSIVNDVPRRLLRSVSNDDYLEAVQKATNALFLTRCFLSTFIKECSDEELLHVFNVPLLKEIIITPSNYNRYIAALIKTYGETAFLLIETVVDVIVSHSSQEYTNKLYMEALGVLLTLFSRLLQKEDLEYVVSPVSPHFSPYFLLDLFYICSGMPLTTDGSVHNTKEGPSWAAGLLLSLFRRMTDNDLNEEDIKLYTTQPSMLLYPFQLFGFLSQHQYTHKVFSICSTRCELILCLFLSVNCSTINPFVYTLNRLINTRSTDVQVVEEEACRFSFDTLYELVIRDLEEPSVSILFYHLLHKVPSFLEFVIAKSEYPFIPKMLKLLHGHGSLSDQQLYLYLTILLSFSQNRSFTSTLFSISAQTSEYAFFMEKVERDPWCVGHLLEVLLVQILYSHLHQPADFYLLSIAMALLCNLLQQTSNVDKFTSRKLVELLLFLNRRFQLSKNSTGKMDEDTILNNVSELLSFYLDALASFLTSERPSVNVCLVYELLRKYDSVKLITIHPEFSQVTTMIMMVLDYLNAALEVNPKDGDATSEIYNNYDSVLSKLSNEVKSWSFIYRKGSAKYEFEDSDCSIFFLSYCWDLFNEYCSDL